MFPPNDHLVRLPISKADLGEWTRLVNDIGEYDQTGEKYTPTLLEEELDDPSVDSELDTLAIYDGDLMVAYGQLHVTDGLRDGYAKAIFGGGVDPRYRRRGLGSEVTDWLFKRALVKAAEKHPGAPTKASMWIHHPGSADEFLALKYGFERARYFSDMRVDFDVWEPPAGFEIGAPPRENARAIELDPAKHGEATRLAHNEAFADHWGSSPRSKENWEFSTLGSVAFRPTLSRIAINPEIEGDDAVDAYVLATEYQDKELYISIVGTRRRARGQGLATELLVESLKQAQREGFVKAELGVDSASPTGANTIYERIGFRVTRTSVVMERLLA
ncbi:GNAT family N-acetyltransferase [Neomicrococcus lactis]|uniref:Ribosomal protein S18 acetylase RimI-like enzyme n=1 Tax=Neomicrococcus lactis TaxID=732241 RepID=A0A7W9DCF8_9MICC|nr:ribosomal protein S18 acetylase RimI-like enzyme [Neomicrococcus lactis]